MLEKEHSNDSNLVRPLDLGHTTLKNSVLMGAMRTGWEEPSHGVDKRLAYCAKRAINQGARLAAQI